MTDAGTQHITAAVAEAASVPDALDDLIQRSTIDPSAPFARDVAAALADLQRENPRAFEGLRARLKDVGAPHDQAQSPPPHGRLRPLGDRV